MTWSAQQRAALGGTLKLDCKLVWSWSLVIPIPRSPRGGHLLLLACAGAEPVVCGGTGA